MDRDLLILFAGVTLSVACLGLALNGALASRHKNIRSRAEALGKRALHGDADAQGAATSASVKRSEGRSAIPTVDRLVKKYLPQQSQMRARLAQTGRNITLGTYFIVSVVSAVVAFFVTWKVLTLPLPLCLALGLVAGIGLPHIVVGKMIRGRLNRFTGQFPEAIDLIVRGLKSGLPVTESIAAVGQEMPRPVGTEFNRISEAIRFGQPIDDALWDASTRLDTQDFKFFVISLSVQRETGGNLGETLSNLSEILRRRRQMKLKIKAFSAEARISALILTMLPFFLFGVIFLINPSYASMLFLDPRGNYLIGAALIWMGLGIGVIRKMINFEI